MTPIISSWNASGTTSALCAPSPRRRSAWRGSTVAISIASGETRSSSSGCPVRITRPAPTSVFGRTG